MAEWRSSNVFKDMRGASLWKVRVDKGSHSGDKPVLQLLLGKEEEGKRGATNIAIVKRLVSTR